MDDPRWLRLITIGLVLAALAVGYFLLTGRLSSNSTTKTATPTASVLGQNANSTPPPAGGSIPTSTPVSAYNRIVSRTQNNTQTLPRTGFPATLAVIFSISAVISGWGLRKYPH